VQSVFLSKEDAIRYATGRVCFRSGEIRVLDAAGAVERVIPFDNTDRKLWQIQTPKQNGEEERLTKIITLM
jgi:hypothetical protein